MANTPVLTVFIRDEYGVTQHAAIRDTADEINGYLREFGLDLGDTEIDPLDNGHYIVNLKAPAKVSP